MTFLLGGRGPGGYTVGLTSVSDGSEAGTLGETATSILTYYQGDLGHDEKEAGGHRSVSHLAKPLGLADVIRAALSAGFAEAVLLAAKAAKVKAKRSATKDIVAGKEGFSLSLDLRICLCNLTFKDLVWIWPGEA